MTAAQQRQRNRARTILKTGLGRLSGGLPLIIFSHQQERWRNRNSPTTPGAHPNPPPPNT